MESIVTVDRMRNLGILLLGIAAWYGVRVLLRAAGAAGVAVASLRRASRGTSSAACRC